MADTPTHREQRKAETKQSIYTTGIELFSERGYSRTTVSSIARGARIAPRTFFTYYASKKDILFEIPQRYSDMLIAQLMTKSLEQPTIDVFRDFLYSVVNAPPPDYSRRSDLQVYEIIFRSPDLQEYAVAMKQRLIDAFCYGFAQEMNCEIDDLIARVAGETVVNSFWTAGSTLLPYDTHFTHGSIDAYFTNLSTVLECLQRQLGKYIA